MQACQKMRLCRKSGELEASLTRRLGHAGKVDPSGDVLQPDVRERIVAEAMPEMAHQGALVPLGQVVVRPRQAVVEPQNCAAAQALRNRSGPRADARAVFGYIAIIPTTAGRGELMANFRHRRVRGTRGPREFLFRDRDAHLLHGIRVPTKASNRQRVQHLRSEDNTPELQSNLNLVSRLLLEKKKNKQTKEYMISILRKNDQVSSE